MTEDERMYIIDSILESQFTLKSLLIVLGSALVCGLLISLLYLFVGRNESYSRGLALTVVMLPMTVSLIIMMVSSDWSSAFSVAGAFALIRFRSTSSNPKNLAYIFAAVSIGLACGKGFIMAAGIFLVIFAATILVLHFVKFGEPRKPKMTLKITIPENLNYSGVFDEVLAKYTDFSKLVKIKSSNFGTMFDLTYITVFKKDIDQKVFLDDLRTLNGNLNIMLQDYVYDPDNVM